MKNVSVITAVNPGHCNAGMLTVELAFADFCRQAIPDININWCHPYSADIAQVKPRSYVNSAELPFNYSVIDGSAKNLSESDAIFFWGDFLQARHFIVGEAASRFVSAGLALNHEDAVNKLSQIFLLSDATEETLKKTIVVGSTILYNAQSDYSDPSYGIPFSRLIREAKGVWMRDPISATKVAQLRNGGANVNQGVDCAMLLTDEYVDTMSRTSWADKISNKEDIGIFFGGRTNTPPDTTLDFVETISKKHGGKIDWIPWFGFDYPNYVGPNEFLRNPLGFSNYVFDRNRVTKFMRNDEEYSFGDLLYSLRKYKFIITDTYHLCVNSWRAGTPAICISSSTPLTPAAGGALSLSDYKKLILYSMYDALDYYVESNDIMNSKRSTIRIESLINAIDDRPISDGIVDRIRRHSAGVREELRTQLSELVGKTG